MKNIWLLFLLIFLVWPGPLAQAQEAGSGALKAVEFGRLYPLSEVRENSLNRIIISPEMYLEAQRPDLSDLTVFNQDGRPTPVLLVRPEKAVRPKPGWTIEVPFYSLRGDSQGSAPEQGLSYRAEGGSLELTLKTGPAVAADGSPPARVLVIDASRPATVRPEQSELLVYWTPGSDAGQARRVRVEMSPDLKSWQTIDRDLTLLPTLVTEEGGESRFLGRVKLPPAPAPYLKLTWLDPGDPPVSAATRFAIGRTERLAAAPEVPVELPGRLEVDGEGRPALYYEPGGLAGAVSLNLVLEEAASFESLLWGRSRPDEPWRSLGRVGSFRYASTSAPDGHAVNPAWPRDGVGWPYYRLTPVNDSWPNFKTPPRLQLNFAPRELIFLAQGGGPYLLAVGREQLPFRPPMPPGAEAGQAVNPVAVGPGYTPEITPPPPAPEPAWADGSGPVWVFRAVLGLGLILLAGLAFRLYRQINRSSGNNQTPPR